MQRRILIGLVVTFTVVGVAWLCLRPLPRSFDSMVWQQRPDHSIRYAMHSDFLKRYPVVGMSKERLIELLGQPDSQSSSELSWDLGRYFGADDSAIDFKLKDGKITGVEVWGH